jgi:hypothetical protein
MCAPAATVGSMPNSLAVRFDPTPLTFVELPGFTTVWNWFLRRKTGVYLWTIEQPDGYLVNYVGKTSARTGFEGRLWTEFNDWKAGRYCTPVDLDAFVRGERRELPAYVPGQHAREVATLAPLYRIFLVPIEGDAACRAVESFIVDSLRATPQAFQFLCNKDKGRAYRPGVERIEIVDAPRLIGISVTRERTDASPG